MGFRCALNGQCGTSNSYVEKSYGGAEYSAKSDRTSALSGGTSASSGGTSASSGRTSASSGRTSAPSGRTSAPSGIHHLNYRPRKGSPALASSTSADPSRNALAGLRNGAIARLRVPAVSSAPLMEAHTAKPGEQQRHAARLRDRDEFAGVQHLRS